MTFEALTSELLQQARGIARDVLQREGVRLRTATVLQVDPVRIMYDGEDTPSVVPPRVAAVVSPGDRVVVAKSRGQATILGVLGVTAPPQPTWQALTLTSPWKPYVGGGNYYSGMRARKIEAGIQVDMMIVGGAKASTICQLPEHLMTGQAHQLPANANGRDHAVIYYHSTGRVQLLEAPATVNYLIGSHILPV